MGGGHVCSEREAGATLPTFVFGAYARQERRIPGGLSGRSHAPSVALCATRFVMVVECVACLASPRRDLLDILVGGGVFRLRGDQLHHASHTSPFAQLIECVEPILGCLVSKSRRFSFGAAARPRSSSSRGLGSLEDEHHGDSP